MTITYFIQHRGVEDIKIGASRTLAHRTDAKRDFPRGMIVLGYMAGNHEADLHRRFAMHQIHADDGGREWFRPHFQIATFISDHCRIVDARALRRLLDTPVTQDSVPLPDVQDFICTHYWELHTLSDHGKIYQLLDVKCKCAKDDSGALEESADWDGPNSDCPGCCVDWGLMEIWSLDDFVTAIGLHEDRREIWVFLKPATSRRRRDLINNELLNAFTAIHIGGWWLCGLTHLEWPPKKMVVVAWNELFMKRWQDVHEGRVDASDAMCDWMTVAFRNGDLSYPPKSKRGG